MLRSDIFWLCSATSLAIALAVCVLITLLTGVSLMAAGIVFAILAYVCLCLAALMQRTEK